MKRQYLGDSYDAVKRLWQQIVQQWAPLHAEPSFIPDDLREEFTLLTGIPMAGEPLPTSYSLFNDPDTGIRLPGRANQTEGPSHITLPTILDQLHHTATRCVITFDQSNYRGSGMTRDSQREAKIRWLVSNGAYAFYYVSHAPFLFAFPCAQEEVEARPFCCRLVFRQIAFKR